MSWFGKLLGARGAEAMPVKDDLSGPLKKSSFMAATVDISPADAKKYVCRTDMLPHSASKQFRSLYGQACALYRDEEYTQAEKLFTAAMEAKGATRSERMLATYARLLAAHELGGEAVIPVEFQKNPEVCGNVFLAVTIASHLVHDGHKAVAWGDDKWNVIAEVAENLYHLWFSSLSGAFMNSGDWLNGSHKTGIFEAAKSGESDSPHAYVLALFQDVPRSQSPIPLPEVSNTNGIAVVCVRCGRLPSTAWQCRKCNTIYCQDCAVAATNSPKLWKIEAEHINVLDTTDDGSRPTCPKCGSNLGTKAPATPPSIGSRPMTENRRELARTHNNRGNSYAVKGEYDKAVADYNKAIEIDPEYANAYNNRGNCFAEQGQDDKAIGDFTKAIELFPGYVEAYYDRGITYAKQKRHDQAITDYTKAIELRPDYAPAYVNRGLCYAERGENEKAIADYETYLRIKPDARTADAVRANIDILKQGGFKDLDRYADMIAAKVKNTVCGFASGLYDHEASIRKLGEEINASYGLAGMQCVWEAVRKLKGPGPTSELNRIWNRVGKWQS